jgi:hypothetical protein
MPVEHWFAIFVNAGKTQFAFKLPQIADDLSKKLHAHHALGPPDPAQQGFVSSRAKGTPKVAMIGGIDIHDKRRRQGDQLGQILTLLTTQVF